MLPTELHFNERGEVVTDAAGDAAASLHEIGTFAQVSKGSWGKGECSVNDEIFMQRVSLLAV